MKIVVFKRETGSECISLACMYFWSDICFRWPGNEQSDWLVLSLPLTCFRFTLKPGPPLDIQMMLIVAL